MSKLRIYFDGLCTFAATNPPPKNGDVPADDCNNEMSVLLIDARNHPRMPHDPQLSLKVGKVTGSSSPINGMWDLDREHLEISLIDATGAEKPLARNALRIVRNQRIYFDSGEPANAFPVDAQEEADLSWIPSISQIDPNLTIDPDLLKPIVTKNHLAARFALTQGTLKVSSFVRDPNDPLGGIAAYEFCNGHGRQGNLRQALAEGVTAEIELPEGSQVKIRLRKLAGSTQERWVTLASSDSGDDIEVMIANKPRGSIDISHFAMFYDLMKGNSARRLIPQISKTNRLIARNGRRHAASDFLISLSSGDGGNPDACPFVQGP
jgi:hypothetical protein